MENRLAGAMAQEATVKMTENGDKAYSTTRSACLDLFALGGSLRSRSDNDILHLWEKAEAEDPITAYKLLFLIRSIKEGYGERRTFRVIWNSLDSKKQNALNYFVSKTGRFDDLEQSILTNPSIAKVIRENLEYEYHTLDEGHPSLIAKWLPCGRGNATAKSRTRRMAKALGYTTEKEYRKVVTGIRKHLNLVESLMVQNRWSEIDYSKIPSIARHKYVKAFYRHDNERFSKFIEDSLKDKENKVMKVENLTPTDILCKVVNDPSYKKAGEAEWRNLPDFTGGHSGIALIDTSGSMSWSTLGNNSRATPLIASSAMGIYFAERNKGPFKNLFLTFSSNPSFVDISKETTLERKFSLIANTEWNGSTNLSGAFDAILDLAKRNGCNQEELPETLYIFSDMEFDRCCLGAGDSSFERAKKAYEKEGYRLPNVVFWNLCARNDTLPVQKDEQGVALVSGYSPRIFKMIMKGEFNPETVMEEALNNFSLSQQIETALKEA